MAMADGNLPTKMTFEFDIPIELVNFMKKFAGNENMQNVIEKIISEGVTNHVKQTLDDLQKVLSASDNLNIGLREGKRREETMVQY